MPFVQGLPLDNSIRRWFTRCNEEIVGSEIITEIPPGISRAYGTSEVLWASRNLGKDKSVVEVGSSEKRQYGKRSYLTPEKMFSGGSSRRAHQESMIKTINGLMSSCTHKIRPAASQELVKSRNAGTTLTRSVQGPRS